MSLLQVFPSGFYEFLWNNYSFGRLWSAAYCIIKAVTFKARYSFQEREYIDYIKYNFLFLLQCFKTSNSLDNGILFVLVFGYYITFIQLFHFHFKRTWKENVPAKQTTGSYIERKTGLKQVNPFQAIASVYFNTFKLSLANVTIQQIPRNWLMKN